MSLSTGHNEKCPRRQLFSLEVRLLALAFFSFAATVQAAETLRPAQPAKQSIQAESPWSRIVLIGASATAGMIDPAATNAICALAPYLESALLVPHEPVRSVASRLFFFGPQRSGMAQMTKAIAHEPSMVIGIDFLFWYCYGDAPSEAARLQRLEQGLALLEPLKCPLVLGDIPDASAAANGMLSPAQIPTAKTIATANERIRTWAAARRHTGLVSLESFMRAARENQPLKIRNRQWRESKSLLQHDKLHPSARGAIALTLAVLDWVVSGQNSADEKDVRWDLQELVAKPRAPAATPVNATAGK